MLVNAEREPCTYTSSADTSDHKSLWLCFKLLSHDMCLSHLYNRYTAVDQPGYMRRTENNLPCPTCVQEYLCTRCICVCVCVCACGCVCVPVCACNAATCPSGVALISAVIPPLACMWWCILEGTAWGILVLIMKAMVGESRGFGSTNKNIMLH